jgi:hypothetical protein
MTATSLLPNQCGRFSLGAADAGGAARPATFAVKIADSSLGYVALQSGNQVWYVPKGVGVTTITISGASADGTALTPVSMQFTTATPPPPQASTFTESAVEIRGQDITTPADPGSDTVTGSL